MIYEDVQFEDYVICLECKGKYKALYPQHLKKCSGITFDEYKEKYPGAPTVSKSVSRQRSKQAKEMVPNLEGFKRYARENPDAAKKANKIMHEKYKDKLSEWGKLGGQKRQELYPELTKQQAIHMVNVREAKRYSGDDEYYEKLREANARGGSSGIKKIYDTGRNRLGTGKVSKKEIELLEEWKNIFPNKNIETQKFFDAPNTKRGYFTDFTINDKLIVELEYGFRIGKGFENIKRHNYLKSLGYEIVYIKYDDYKNKTSEYNRLVNKISMMENIL